MAHRILLIEGDLQMAAYIEKGLTEEGMIVEHAATGPSGLLRVLDDVFEAVLLERKLPGCDGMQVLRTMRESGSRVPVMIVSSLSTVEDKVTGLTSGADDYLAKPFAFSELLARLKLHIGRSSGGATTRHRLRYADLEMDLGRREVRKRGRLINLQRKPFFLLEHFLRNQGKVLTQAEIREAIWGQDTGSDVNMVAVLISRLRRELGDDGSPSIIKTVRGVGYCLGGQ